MISYFFPINPKIEIELKLKEEKDEMSYGRGTPALHTHCVLGCLPSRSQPRPHTAIRTLGTRMETEALMRYPGRAGTFSLSLSGSQRGDAGTQLGTPLHKFLLVPEQFLFSTYNFFFPPSVTNSGFGLTGKAWGEEKGKTWGRRMVLG